ncbi:MAG: hypothetical protein J6Z35_10945 [Lachnospiraceae bacterium]|nr:hypothetical protein [Lachnospiraceae bacterium]
MAKVTAQAGTITEECLEMRCRVTKPAAAQERKSPGADILPIPEAADAEECREMMIAVSRA